MNVSVDPFALSLAEPLHTAADVIGRREGFVLRVERRGVRGHGEATPLAGWTETLADCEAGLDAARRPLQVDDSAAALDATRDAPAARHAVSLALADLEAREFGEPLYRRLGGRARVESVPVNAVVGATARDAAVDAAESAVDAGFDCLKLKVGTGEPAATVERVRGVREAVGSDVVLRLDANAAWNRDQAERAFEALAPLDVAYVEQPLPADDLAGHAALRGGPVGVALDESLARLPIDDVLDADAADVVVLKPMALGGVDRARVIAERARSSEVDVVVTTTVDGVLARTAAVHLAASLDGVLHCGLATGGHLETDLGPDPAPVEHGRVAVPQGNGLGTAPTNVE